MKPFLALLMLAISALADAQEPDVVPEGTPALLTVANGKQIRVFLQAFEQNEITFLPYKAQEPYSVPADKIRSLEFFPKYDEVEVARALKAGEDDRLIELLEEPMRAYAPYMPMQNNLSADFALLMEAHRRTGNLDQANDCATLLMQSSDAALVLLSRVCKAQVALREGNLEQAEQLSAQVKNPAAALYVKAGIERGRGNPRQAMYTVTEIIADHANAVEWLAPAEFLAAELYLDMGMTNSAANTARQVSNIYAGTAEAAEAAELYAQLQSADDV